jgi:hypothetical protein
MPDPRRAYLLGLLPDDEAARLEEEYFADAPAFEAMLAAEDELVDDYVAGALSETDRRAFEQRTSERPELARRLGARQALDGAFRLRGARDRRARRRVLPLVAAFAAAALVVVMARAPRRPPSVLVTSATPTLSPSAAPSAVSTVVLLLGGPGVRGQASVSTARLPPGTTVLRLRQAQASSAGPETRGVVLEDVDGHRLWAGRAGRPASGEPVLETDVPAEILRAGDYIARFGEVETFFRVQR